VIADFERVRREKKTWRWDDFRAWCYSETQRRGFPHLAVEYSERLVKDVAAWAAFCEDRNVHVHAVEYPVWGTAEVPVATLIDVVATIDFNRKRELCIINLKSNFNGEEDEPKRFYKAQDCQLQIEKYLWMQHHQTAPLTLNWSPNNWTDRPTYTLKNWEKTNWSAEKLNDYLRILKYEMNPPRRKIVLRGEYRGNVASNLFAVRLETDEGEPVDNLTQQLTDSLKKEKSRKKSQTKKEQL
jgi:hypothetical protein